MSSKITEALVYSVHKSARTIATNWQGIWHKECNFVQVCKNWRLCQHFCLFRLPGEKVLSHEYASTRCVATTLLDLIKIHIGFNLRCWSIDWKCFSGAQHSFDLRNHQTFPAKWSSLLYMQRVQSSKSKCYFQSCILFEYRARNFIFWKGLVIPQIKTMLRPHSNVSDLESWSVIATKRVNLIKSDFMFGTLHGAMITMQICCKQLATQLST